MSQITFEQFANTIREVAGEKPDYKYEAVVDPMSDIATCAYSTQDAQPSCLIGQAIFRLDPDAFQSIHAEEWDEDHGLNSTAADDLPWITQRFTAEQGEVIRRTQCVQDSGKTWGEAIATMDEEIKELEVQA